MGWDGEIGLIGMCVGLCLDTERSETKSRYVHAGLRQLGVSFERNLVWRVLTMVTQQPCWPQQHCGGQDRQLPAEMRGAEWNFKVVGFPRNAKKEHICISRRISNMVQAPVDMSYPGTLRSVGHLGRQGLWLGCDLPRKSFFVALLALAGLSDNCFCNFVEPLLHLVPLQSLVCLKCVQEVYESRLKPLVLDL